MRSFEILILISNTVLLWLLVKREQRAAHYIKPLVFLIVVITILHLLFERYRWQMTPAYCLAALLTSMAMRSQSVRLSTVGSRRYKYVLGLFGFIFLIVATLLSSLLPVPRMPKLTGPFSVGTSTIHLIDEDRSEIYSVNSNDPRELMVQIWYPAEKISTSKIAPYIIGIKDISPAVARRFNLPSFLLQHLNLVNSHAWSDPPLLEHQGPYPLLIFSHGLRGMRTQNTNTFVELASNGYIVVSIDHTFDSIAVLFPDDRITYHIPEMVLPEDEPFIDSASRLIQVRAADVGFVLDEISEADEDTWGRFEAGIDLSRVAYFGHSTGGGTAIEACSFEQRCQAYAALDGWLEPLPETTLGLSANKPALFLNTREWLNPSNRALGEAFARLQTSPTFFLVVDGTDHNNFSDISLMSPLTHQIGLTGQINGRRGLKIMNAYLLAFFDQYLKNRPALLLDGPSDLYPEVEFVSDRP